MVRGAPRVVGFIGVAALAVVGACKGVLREKVGESSIDASILTTIPPPSCTQPVTPMDTGDCTNGQKPGSDCLMCHHQGGTGIPFAFAGTLYDPTGTQAVGGASVILQDSTGNVATAISHPTNGNFYTTDGFVAFPAKAFVTLCPNVVEMIGPVDETTGANCNTTGCHTAGFRVHLP